MLRLISPYSQPALAVLTDALKAANPRLSAGQIQLDAGYPQSQEDGTVTVAMRHRSTQALQKQSPVMVSYRRQQLDSYFLGFTPPLDAALGTTDEVLFAQLLDRYQLFFLSEDASVLGQHNGASWTIDTLSTSPTAVLQPGANHLVWEGSFVFPLTGVVSLGLPGLGGIGPVQSPH